MAQGYLEIISEGENKEHEYEIYPISNLEETVRLQIKKGAEIDLGKRGKFFVDSVFSDSHFVYIAVDKKRKV